MPRKLTRIRNAVLTLVDGARRHVVATGLVGALAAGSLAGGVGFAVSRPAAAAVGTASLTAASATPGAKAAHRGPHGAPALRALIGLVAKDTNQTKTQVLAQLKAGKSLDQIAGSKAAAIRQEALSRIQARLDKAVKAGKLTQDQANTRLADWKTRLAKVMSTPGTSLPMRHARTARPPATTPA